MATNNPRKIKEAKSAQISSSSGSRKGLTGNRPSVDPSRKVDPSGTIDPALSGQFESSTIDESGPISPSSAASTGPTSGEVVAIPTAEEASSELSEAAETDEPSIEAGDGSSAPLPTLSGESVIKATREQEEREVKAEKERRKRRRRRVIKWVLISLVVVVVAAIVAICAAFSINRWETYDDSLDIQGMWTVSGSDAPITIDEDMIRLTDDVAYKYVIDEDAKTLTFMFGNLTGSARYRFSLDRESLMIEDGEFDWWGNLTDDAEWMADALFYKFKTDKELSPAEGEVGAMLLDRKSERIVPSNDSAEPADATNDPDEGSDDASAPDDGGQS